MIFKIYKLFEKITSSFVLILINILLISILFIFSESAFSNNNDIVREITYKYCDSIEKNLFKGLDNEKILKYEYLFKSINKEALFERLNELSNFPGESENICLFKISNEEKEEFKKMLHDFISNK